MRKVWSFGTALDDQLLTQDKVFALKFRSRLQSGVRDEQKPGQERNHRASL
jgi:hypothetical protein